ncbi:MAG TPA: helix-turn-helix domain-containing protein [Pseudonocardiaceae bacterium]|jgi:transcriptional regulator with XRE-family HTH domain|nr:helix-turn-helix domain-containing protein [Pseudonocardiaceae bacterium]
MATELPPPSGEVDPTTVTSREEFARRLQALTRRSGLSYAEISKKSGGQISKGSITSLFKGDRLPTRLMLYAFLNAFGLPEPEINAWNANWAELGEAEADQDTNAVVLFKEQSDGELTAVDTRITQYEQHEARVRQELQSVRNRVRDLEHESSILTKQTVELEQQLDQVRAELRRAYAERNRLVEQNRVLAEALDAIRLQYDRAEYERSRRETAERSLTVAQERILFLEVQQAVGPTTSRPPQAPEKHIESERPKNAPFETEIAVRDRDFGKPYELWITFPWYCENCKIGGSQERLVCPNCKSHVLYEETQPVKIKMPKEPCYGKTLVVPDVGNLDDLELKRGDVHIQVVQKESRWGR